MSDLSIRQMARLLKKLSLRDGDILLVKRSKFDEHEILEGLRRGMEHLDTGKVLVIMLDNFEDITTLNHQEMNSHGWYHASDINKLVVRHG